MQLIIAQTQNNTTTGGQDDPLGSVQEIEIWPYEQMVYA